MSNRRHITFIGGSQDLTRRVMDVACRYIKFPKVGPMHAGSLDADAPVVYSYETETYVLQRVSERHFVAILDEDIR